MIGFILCAALSTSVIVIASTQTVTREITYGVGVMLNGEIVHFDEESRPFVMDNRTFLPFRALAELTGLPVDFDPAINTVILGDRFAGQTRPLTQAAPHFDTGVTGSWNDRTSVVTRNSAAMGGIAYNDVIVFRSRDQTALSGANNLFTLHNLNGQFRMLTGYIGRVDGSGMLNGSVSFYGDGQLLQTVSLNATEMPSPISVFVEGINQLRVEFRFSGPSSPRTEYALQGFLE